MKIKLLNLNLWNYNNWEERRPKILQLVKKHRPEIIFLQEVRDDVRFNKKGDDQAKQLNKELSYPYYVFYPVCDKRKEKPEKYDKPCLEGTAILSKYPIAKIDKRMLKKHPEDKYSCGNLFIKIRLDNKSVDLVAVHFSNSDLFSLLHLIETLKQIRSKKISPIIIGDFNIYHQDWLNDLTEQDYVSSMKYKKYISYPSNKMTLDYILIPKDYKFKSLKCEGDISDHKSLIAEVELK